VDDLDGDGDRDVVLVSMANDWTNPANASIVWLENDGRQSFRTWQIDNAEGNLVATLTTQGKALTGSIAVKELFTRGARTGWAVDAKAADGRWLFFEGFEPALDQFFFRGSGNLCARCHSSGIDFVLTPPEAFP
jgi:hypothetical protein